VDGLQRNAIPTTELDQILVKDIGRCDDIDRKLKNKQTTP
jgi:hypothetical protein